MKVVSSELVLSLMETMKIYLEHQAGMLRISVSAKQGDSWDLLIAEGNIETINRHIELIKKTEFLASELYPEKGIA